MINDEPRKRHRRNDHDTSVRGAYEVSFRAGTQKAALLIAHFDHGDLNATEAAQAAGVPLTSCYWKRCSELRDLGLIEPLVRNGEVVERPGIGGLQMVCVITDAGIEVVRGLLK